MVDLVENATDVPSLFIGRDERGVYFFAGNKSPNEEVPHAPLWSNYFKDSGEQYQLHSLPGSELRNWRLKDQAGLYASFRSTVERSQVVVTTNRPRNAEEIVAHTDVFPEGNYTFSWSYGWNYDSTSSDIVIWLDVDGYQVGLDHREEPKDASKYPDEIPGTGSSQTKWVSRRKLDIPLSAGSHTVRLFLASSSRRVKASIFEVSVEILRTS